MSSVIASGTFTSNGSALSIQITPEFDKFELINITDIGSTAMATPVMKATYTSAMTAGSAYVSSKTSGAATVALETTITANGFTPFNGSIQTPGPAIGPGTAITAANPAVVTINGHGLSVGNRIRLYNCVGMQQISGMTFTVTDVVDANDFEISLNAGGFAAAATAVTARLLTNPIYQPRDLFITNITQAVSAVVTVSEVTTSYEVGDYITFNIPASWGMTQLNGITAEITAIGVDGTSGATTYTINVNTTAFSAFVFPVSGAVPFSFAQLSPTAEIATKITNPERNVSQRGLILGTGVQTNAKLYQWFAYSTFGD